MLQLSSEQEFQVYKLKSELPRLSREELEAYVIQLLTIQYAKDNFWKTQIKQQL